MKTETIVIHVSVGIDQGKFQVSQDVPYGDFRIKILPGK